jgi:hypothetical protein
MSSRLDSAQPSDLVSISFLIDSVIRIAFHYFFPATCDHSHLTALYQASIDQTLQNCENVSQMVIHNKVTSVFFIWETSCSHSS